MRRTTLILAISLGAVSTAIPVCQAQEAAAVSDEVLASVLKWMNDHVVVYRNSKVYELGPDDLVLRRPPLGATAISSFELPRGHTHWQYLCGYGRAWLYDTALATIVYSHVGKYDKARGLLLTLEHLQNQDGSIGFSWNTHGGLGEDGFYNRSYKRTGSIAWAGYAAVTYERLSGDKGFRNLAEKAAGYILAQQINDPKDRRFGLVKGGHGFWSPDYREFFQKPAEYCATEHQIDCYFFLRDLSRLTGTRRYRDAADLLKRRMLEVLWDDDKGRFNAAVDAKGVNRDRPLDASSWGAIFLAAIGEFDKARRALAYVERTFKSSVNNIAGYKAYAGQYQDHPMHDWGKVDMVWSEGSLGVAMAHLRLGNVRRCEEIENEVVKMRRTTGGICYTAYRDELPLPPEAIKKVDGQEPTDRLDEFLRCPSVAGTAWMALVRLARLKGADVLWGPDAQFPNSERGPNWKVIQWAGRSWLVKRGEGLGPGPNTWGADNVWVDQKDDSLHLALTERNGKWTCAEVVADRPVGPLGYGEFGYGEYRWVVSGDFQGLDDRAVFAAFIWSADDNESDLEISRWARTKADETDNAQFAQFVVQPAADDSLHRFPLGITRVLTIVLNWNKDALEWSCWPGDKPDGKPPASWRWTYRGPKLPRPTGDIRPRASLWLFQGKPPVVSKPQEVVIHRFVFVPARSGD